MFTLTFALAAALAPPSARPDTTLALATFDSAWTIVRNTHYDPGMNGVDWDAVRAELRPLAARAASTNALRDVIADMLRRIGESHYGLIPIEAVEGISRPQSTRTAHDGDAPPGDIGAKIRLVEGRFVVSRIDSGAPASMAGLRLGDEVEQIESRDLGHVVRSLEALTDARQRSVATVRATMVAEAMLAGDSGSTVDVQIRDRQGSVRVVSLVRRRAPGAVARVGNGPGLLADLSYERRDVAGGCVGVIRFSVWMTTIVRPFDDAMRALRSCRGIVLDVRGNPGGMAAMVMGLAGYFLDEPDTLGAMRTRTGELSYVVNPRRSDASGEPMKPFAGPLAIVVDGLSASTTEIFAAGLQHLGRARIFGDTSAGQALPAVLTTLPNGDVLLHAIADYRLPDGRRIEGKGVVPDVLAAPTIAGLRAGRDEAGERALGWAVSTSPER